MARLRQTNAIARGIKEATRVEDERSAWDDNSSRAKNDLPAKIRGQINTALTKLLYLCQHRINYLAIFFTGMNLGLFKRAGAMAMSYPRILVTEN